MNLQPFRVQRRRLLALFVVSALATRYLHLELSTYLPTRDDDSIFGYQYHASFATSQTPQEVLWNRTTDEESSSMRRWGCHRSETPLIFVHIGKAGGGMVRARFAASALNYDRAHWTTPHKDEHYYPISQVRKGGFCNSNNANHFIPNSRLEPHSFEGNVPCNATTPMGLAVACPENTNNLCLGCQDFKSKHCDTVYVGHNNLGSELHWLPPSYLQQWWDSHWASQKYADLSNAWAHLTSNEWCHSFPRPDTREDIERLYNYCSVPLAAKTDHEFNHYWKYQTKRPKNYSPIYASLPLHRVTLMRDPWPWLVSKFFWHKLYRRAIRCEDLEAWAPHYALRYIMYLCGDDCMIRYENGLMSLDELEAQAESNLRQAFSVVGLLNETDQFYKMVSKRIAYIDMKRNPHVQGDPHHSVQMRESVQCLAIVSSPAFQEQSKQQFPSLGVLDRLYQVGVQVNRFQQEELRQCK